MYTYMHVKIHNRKKKAMNLKKNKEGFKGRSARKKGKGTMM